MVQISNSYEADIIGWAQEQARLLRARRFDSLDIEHIAEEIEDVGKSEQRELESRMALLLAHLLKWQHQPERRGSSWEASIRHQRQRIGRRLERTPSLKPDLDDPEWWAGVWADALDLATRETGLSYEDFPAECPWEPADILNANFWPGA